MCEPQFLAAASPALLLQSYLTAPGTAVRPCKEAQHHRNLDSSLGIRCPPFTHLHGTASFTICTSDAYGLPKPVTTGPQAETDLAKGIHPKPQLKLDPKLHSSLLQDREAL